MRTGIRRQSTTVMAQPSVAGRMASGEWKPCVAITAGWWLRGVIAASTTGTSQKTDTITRGGATTTTDIITRASIVRFTMAAMPIIATFLLTIRGRPITAGHITGGRYRWFTPGDGMGR